MRVITRARTDDIDPGERAGRDCGDLTDLVQSITSGGMRHPVTVSARDRLITGKRRLDAARKAGWEMLPVRVISTVQEALDALAAEQGDGQHELPKTTAEIFALDAAVRELAWWPKRPPGQRLKGHSDVDGHLAQLARAYGITPRHYAWGRQIYQAAQGYDEQFSYRHPVDGDTRAWAELAVTRIAAGMPVVTAYRLYMSHPPGTPGPALRPAAAISQATAMLSAITAGLSAAQIGTDAAPGEIARWDRELATAQAHLRAFRTTIGTFTEESRH